MQEVEPKFTDSDKEILTLMEKYFETPEPTVENIHKVFADFDFDNIVPALFAKRAEEGKSVGLAMKTSQTIIDMIQTLTNAGVHFLSHKIEPENEEDEIFLASMDQLNKFTLIITELATPLLMAFIMNLTDEWEENA